MLGEALIALSRVEFHGGLFVLTCKSMTESSNSNWVPVLTNALLLARTNSGVLFFFFSGQAIM